MTAAIDIRAVTRTYGHATALDNVSFRVPEGSICGLFGSNGAGKTTVMSIIAGHDRPSSGEALVLGDTPFEHEPTVSRISFIKDNQRYPDNYQLKHVLRIAPEFAPDWSAEVAAELVDGFRIPAKTPIKKFSRGQLSAVAIVLGLASRAPVTLFDEPYLGLDVGARTLFYDVLLRDYGRHPRTILLSTHLIDESESLFDRVVILNAGRVAVDCDRDEARELAVVISGAADAVGRLTVGRTVLQTRAIGSLSSVTVTGDADEALLAEARRTGVQVASASLQQLVAAYGAPAGDAAEQTDHQSNRTTQQKEAAAA
jgi:ABC-2 type transport system ATP-binding protein